jgi:hypothetical protein
MISRFLAVLATLCSPAGLGVGAAEIDAPGPLTRIGSSEKICQLTGDTDWETGQPTAARTFRNFGLDAADLGYPVEHGGKLILLFGTAGRSVIRAERHARFRPTMRSGSLSGGRRRATTASAWSCKFSNSPVPPRRLARHRVTGPVPIKQGFFNVPSGGVSVAGGLYAFFFTDHCSQPSLLKPSDAPLARPPVTPSCPENDDLSSIGRGVLARSDDSGRTFTGLVPMPAGFVYSTAINTVPQADLPQEQRLGVSSSRSPAIARAYRIWHRRRRRLLRIRRPGDSSPVSPPKGNRNG